MTSRAINNLIDNDLNQELFLKNRGLEVYLLLQENDDEQLQSDLVSIVHSIAYNGL
jgi:hypothetical protein